MKGTLIAFFLAASGAAAEDVKMVDTGGLAAWDLIYEVASHPRCTNCHVGAQDAPGWGDLGYGEKRRHGMGVLAGDSRIGAETIPCRTCHVTSDAPNSVPHAAPHVLEAWRLPPVTLAWLGKNSAEVCAQLRDPDRNEGHSIEALVAHLQSSPFVAWGFDPGGGRTPAPGTIAGLVRAVETWGRAGAPCR